MKDSHAGMKVSMQDFNDLAGHLVAALSAAKVAQADIDAIVAAVSPMANDIVEDKTNNATVYQRVGRKPAITHRDRHVRRQGGRRRPHQRLLRRRPTPPG